MTGATIIDIRHASGGELLQPGDVLISVGDHEQLLQLEYLAQARKRHGEEQVT